MPVTQMKKSAELELKIGDCVAVTGKVAHSGEFGLIAGFFRRPSDATYAIASRTAGRIWLVRIYN